jgi:hypothetical protein
MNELAVPINLAENNPQKMYKFSELFGHTIQGEGKKNGSTNRMGKVVGVQF